MGERGKRTGQVRPWMDRQPSAIVLAGSDFVKASAEPVGARDIYGGRDPAEVPAYTILDVVKWVRVPASTVRAWVLGQPGFEPVVEIADRRSRTLSFRNLVELHVLSALRREHGVPMQRVRQAVDFLAKRVRAPHPLASVKLFTDGRDLLVEAYEQFMNVTRQGQIESRELAFVLTAGNLPGPEMAAVFVRNLRRIAQIAVTRPGPFIAGVTPSGVSVYRWP